jgi:heme/copper-type cytochrome/quinol oxidase subunit 2
MGRFTKFVNTKFIAPLGALKKTINMNFVLIIGMIAAIIFFMVFVALIGMVVELLKRMKL